MERVRAFISKFVAWLAWLLIRRERASVWTGIALAAVAFGFAHRG